MENTTFDLAAITTEKHESQNGEMGFDLFKDINMKEYYKFYDSYKLATYTVKYAFPPVIAFGLFVNTITIVLVLVSALRKKTVIVAIVALAVVDNGILIINLLYVYLPNVYVDLVSVSHTSCKIANYLNSLLPQLSAWTIVFICYERLIVVLYPMKVKMWLTVTNVALAWV